MIARPKIRRNERKTTEIGAFEVGNFAPFSCPGESGADVYDRVSTWLETLYREMEFGLITPDTTLLLVTHGLTARLILMRWYHWSVEAFEETYNPGNAQLMVMERHTDAEGGLYYVLAPEAIAAIRLPEEAQAQEEIERKRQLLITKNMSARDIKNDSAPPTPAATKKAMSKEDSVEVLEC
jgi:broad specificity phosphatase PhoE